MLRYLVTKHSFGQHFVKNSFVTTLKTQKMSSNCNLDKWEYSNFLNEIYSRIKSSKRSNNPSQVLLKVKELSDLGLDKPYNNYKCIHVAGTNGKGSVCNKLSHVLSYNNKYKVGLFTSPHISSFRERIKINNKMISVSDILFISKKIINIENKFNYKSHWFTFLTLIAFEYFKYKKIDIGVIEVGLGGTYDHTNIIEKPLLSIITNISLDHTEYLGDNIYDICKNKAGIIKNNCPVVIGSNVPKSIIKNKVKETNSKLYQVELENQVSYNHENTEIALLSVNVLSKLLNDKSLLKIDNLNELLLNIKPICRFEEHKFNNINIILDVAHNIDGCKRFFNDLNNKYPKNKYIYRTILGLSTGHTHIDLIKIISNNSDFIHLVKANISRGVEISYLKKLLLDKNINFNEKNIFDLYNGNITKSFKFAINEINNNKNNNKIEILIVTGSFYHMSDIRKCIGINEIID